jgi:predicted anti-sigma-YlaC factor YlaD
MVPVDTAVAATATVAVAHAKQPLAACDAYIYNAIVAIAPWSHDWGPALTLTIADCFASKFSCRL